MIRRPAGRRPAFTLIELMVVIGIIIILATLTAAFLPNLDRNKGVPNNVTQLHGWINLSKQQANRDGSARGVRLFDDGQADPTKLGRVTTLQYIEQPEPVAPRGQGIKVYLRTELAYDPVLFATVPGNVGPLTVVTLYQDTQNLYSTPAYANPPPEQLWLNWDGVQPGDTFQLTGSPTAIAGIRRFTTTIPQVPAPPPPTQPGHPFAQLVLDRVIEGTEVNQNPMPPPALIGNVITASNNFRVIRQPRPLVGEPTLQLHKDIYIDLTRSHPVPSYLAALKPFPPNVQYPNPPFPRFQEVANWAPYTDPNTGLPYLDILFSPSGAVANASYGQIILWIQHNERPTDQLLLTIFTRTGKTAPYNAFDIDPTQYDPYGLARSGQSPGL